MIRIEGLNAGYGPLQVLRDVTLDVAIIFHNCIK